MPDCGTSVVAGAAAIAAVAVIYTLCIRTTATVQTKTEKPRRLVYIDKNPDLVHSLRPSELTPYDYWGDLAPTLVTYAMPNSYGWALEVPTDKPALKKPSRLCITTTALGSEAPLMNTAIKNKEQYAKKYGFGFHAFSDKDIHQNAGDNPNFYKFDAVRKTLESGHCDWVFYMDGTAVFNNDDIRLSDFIVDIPKRVNFVWGWDGDNYKKVKDQPQQSRMYHQLSLGAFFVRNTDWSKKFLDEVEQEQNPEDRKVYTLREDQGAVSEVIYNRGSSGASKYMWVHRRAFNKIHGKWSQVNPKDFVINYHGVCKAGDECAAMQSLLNEIRDD